MLKSKRNKKPFNPNKKVWFDLNCKIKRKIYNRIRKKDLKMNKADADITNLRKKAANDYKKTVRKCRRNYINSFESNLRELKGKNPKEYWRLINKREDEKNIRSLVARNFIICLKTSVKMMVAVIVIQWSQWNNQLVINLSQKTIPIFLFSMILLRKMTSRLPLKILKIANVVVLILF